MSLTIIVDEEELKKSTMKFVDYNDMFFQAMKLNNDEITEKILKKIDCADYVSDLTFIGRDKSLGALNKSLLSTGCKTLLNALYNPGVCFSVAECGPNALEMLSILQNGCVYWENPVLFLTEDISCDFMCRGKHYSNYTDFLGEVMN